MSQHALRPVNILLVDDRRENLLALTAILDRPDYRLLAASSGREALHIALREPLAVILLDAIMPGMDGFEVARHLKEVERTRYIPILFLTALATGAEQLYQAYAVGAVDYLVKPLDAELVRRKVEVFVELARQREAIEHQARLLREAQRREFELRLAESRLANDRRYRKLVKGIDHAIAWSADGDARISFVSQQAPRIMALAAEEFLRDDFWQRHLHPDDCESVLGMFRQALTDLEDSRCDHRLVAGDGSILWFHTSVSGEVTSDGRHELHGISIDVTDLKRNEALQSLLADTGRILAESLDYTATLPRLANRLVATLGDWCLIDERLPDRGPHALRQLAAAHRDADADALLQTLRRDLDARSDDAETTPLTDTLDTGSVSFHAELPSLAWLARALGIGQPAALEPLGASSCVFVPLRVRDQVLGCLTLVSSGARHRLRHGDLEVVEELCRRAGLAMEHARIYGEAQRASRAREELLAVVSHDLRNPLSAITMSGRLLERTAERGAADGPPIDPQKVERGARNILRAAERMDNLIRDLLDFARLDAAQLTIEPAPVEAASLLEESVEMFLPLAREKGVALELAERARIDGLVLSCDRERILRVLSNLIGNAIKFTPAHGTITIAAQAEGHEARVIVRDTGVGMSPDQLERIWERFWQAQPGGEHGVGLGLSIARGLVEAHGGRIWAESERDHGTTFTFTLPRID